MIDPILLVTLGDPNGIGPEVTAKSVRPVCAARPVVLIGSARSIAPWQKYIRRPLTALTESELLSRVTGSSRLPRGVYLIEPESGGFKIEPGKMTVAAGRIAFRSLEVAVRLLRRRPGRFRLVTAPLSKESILRAGIRFSGHTGYLGESFGAKPLMLLIGGRMAVGLVTEHIPLSTVPPRITRKNVFGCLRSLARGLASLGLGTKRTILVLGLNPHSGEGGRIGSEDLRIAAAVRAFNRLGLGRAVGPLPADSAFAHLPGGIGRGHAAHGVNLETFLAMYHDQGLIPVKMAGVHRAVNLTLGLPIRRASPAHGTAFDIAGRGVADPRSMALAIRWALR